MPPAPLDACGDTAGSTWHAVPGLPVAAAETGSGPTVVLLNESGNNACPWLSFAPQIVAQGFRVVVFAYRDPGASAEAQSVTDTLSVAQAVAGKDHYLLLGASLGGRVIIEAAGRRPAQLAGIISLSGEQQVEDYRDILADARKVQVPALYVGALNDNYTAGASQQQALHAAMQGHPNELVQRPGTNHGTDLLGGPDGAAVAPQVLAFIRLVLH